MAICFWRGAKIFWSVSSRRPWSWTDNIGLITYLISDQSWGITYSDDPFTKYEIFKVTDGAWYLDRREFKSSLLFLMNRSNPLAGRSWANNLSSSLVRCEFSCERETCSFMQAQNLWKNICSSKKWMERAVPNDSLSSYLLTRLNVSRLADGPSSHMSLLLKTIIWWWKLRSSKPSLCMPRSQVWQYSRR